MTPKSNPLSLVLADDREELEAKAAHEVEARIKATVGRIRAAWVELAADLYEFTEGELWRQLGYDSLNQWLAGPEIDLERRWVYELLSAYKELVVRRGVEPARLGEINVGKVREILPAVRRGHKTAEEALADAETLGRRDLEERYRGMTTRPPNDPEPPLEATEEPVWATCPACGGRYQVREG